MAVMKFKEEREEKKKKIIIKPYLTTTHALLKNKEDVKTNEMMRWHHNCHHCSQLYAPSKYDREANTLTYTRHSSTTFYFFICKKTKIPLVLNNNNKKYHYRITTKPLKPWLKKLNNKNNIVITLIINL